LVTDGPGRAVPVRAAVDVIIPVYRGVAEFAACWASLRRKPAAGSRKRGWDVRFVVVDDAAPDPALRAEIAGLAQLGEIVLLRHDRNRGFPSAVNTGMRAAPRARRDVVLLNADTLLPVGWLERLANAAYAGGDIGSVTPMTNDGTIMSYPSVARTNPTPDLAATDQLDARMRAANGRGWVEVPTAVGFCMYIRHDCLADVGLFREDAFAQGYGEEVDWCLRARHLGWRHVAATGVFVGHLGGRSFGGGKRHLLARNGAVLNRLHPGYDALIAAFVARDPLADARFRADARAWAERRMAGRAVVLITHADGGGVERFVQERCATLRAGGRRPIVLRPVLNRAPASPHDRAAQHCRVSEGDEDAYPNLCFALPADETQLLRFLQEDTPDAIEVHHLLGYSPSILALIRALGLPYQVFIHDYSYWCPRITLCTKGPRYCGEPLDTQVCDACVMDMGRRTGGDLSVVDMRADSARFLAGAVRVVVSCDDVAGRVARHFPGVHPVIIPWENDASLTLAAGKPPLPGPPWRVLIVGAIGSDKGYESLLGCVRDAAQRDLPLSFIVAGYTMDDTRLMDSGPVFVTGAFEEDEAVSLALAQRAHLGFLPSIWPETWCYALSTLWCAGLDVAAFAFGAPALRISRSGRGVLLPVGLAPGRINDALIQMAIQAHTRTHPTYAHQKAGAETKGSADKRRRTGQKMAASPQIVFSSE
jgi:GT2 family glycosyltransferase/glycosyltransferase involved in cell wall biosynthesis